jgi:hypothetical protein
VDIIIYIGVTVVIFGLGITYSKYKEHKAHKEYVQSIKLEKRNVIYNEDLTNKEIEIFQRVIHFIIKENYLYYDRNKPVKLLLFDLLTLTSLEEARSYDKNMFDKEFLCEKFENMYPETFDDYKQKNESDYSIKKYASSFKNAVLIDCSEAWYRYNNPREYIKYIEKGFGNIDGVIGFVIFSRIGFDDEKKQALLEAYYDIEGSFSNDYIFLRENPHKNRFFISKVENIRRGP